MSRHTIQLLSANRQIPSAIRAPRLAGILRV